MKILVLVPSCNNGIYNELDYAIKNTWGKCLHDNVEVLYYFGYSDNKSIPLQGEAIQEGKDIICGYIENMPNIGRKTVCAFEHVYQNYEFDYIFRCCSGSYIDINKMLKAIEDKPKEKYYGGVIVKQARHSAGQPFISGAGYFLSRDLVQYIVQNKEKWNYALPDDIALSVILRNAMVSMSELNSRIDILNNPLPNPFLNEKKIYNKDFFHYHFCKHPECMYAISKVKNMKNSNDDNMCHDMNMAVSQLCAGYTQAKVIAKGIDIREHLPTLYKYASQCKTITEFGVRDGISSWAFLMGLPNEYTAYDINDFAGELAFSRISSVLGVNYSFIKKMCLMWK